jgi:hypothetical protein
VPASDSGLASGMVNTSFMMGGALGLAVLASFAAAQTEFFTMLGADATEALNSGYAHAFRVGAGFVVVAALLGFIGFPKARPKAGAADAAGGHA